MANSFWVGYPRTISVEPEKIWSIIMDAIAIVAEIFTIDENELMEQIIRDNRRLKAMQIIAQTA